MAIFPLSLNIFNEEGFTKRFGFDFSECNELIEAKNELVYSFPLTIKKNGIIKTRVITAPVDDYKTVLKKINKTFSRSTTWNEWNGVCGSVPNKTLKDMTLPHCNKQCLLKLDIKNFFPNISEERVAKILVKSGTNHEVANVLSKLLTLNSSLPQGYPTSPIIANLIAFNLDSEQDNICKKYNLTRTRWIDDIVISGTTKNVHAATGSLITAIKKNGFAINKKKVHTMYRGAKLLSKKPNAVGLMLDKRKPYIPEYEVEQAENLFHISFEHGLVAAQTYHYNTTLKRPKDGGMLAVLKGKLEFIRSYAPKRYDELHTLLEAIKQNNL